MSTLFYISPAASTKKQPPSCVTKTFHCIERTPQCMKNGKISSAGAKLESARCDDTTNKRLSSFALSCTLMCICTYSDSHRHAEWAKSIVCFERKMSKQHSCWVDLQRIRRTCIYVCEHRVICCVFFFLFLFFFSCVFLRERDGERHLFIVCMCSGE